MHIFISCDDIVNVKALKDFIAKPEEVVRIITPAGKWRTNFPNHDRLTPETGYSSRLGVAETISIALVILRVFWTDAMRRRMSRRLATLGLCPLERHVRRGGDAGAQIAAQIGGAIVGGLLANLLSGNSSSGSGDSW